MSGHDGDPAREPSMERHDSSLRILAVTNMWPENGGYRGIFIQQSVDALRRLGHHVDVEVIAQSRGRIDHFTALLRVRRRAVSGGYDVVHVHYGMTALACRWVGKTPRVLSLYGSDINDLWRRWMTKLGWGGTAARIYVSKRLAASAGDPAGRIIPNGVDLALFRPGDRAASRVQLGLDPRDNVVLFGGDPARPVKGHDVFRDVVATLERRGLRATPLILSEPRQPLSGVVAKLSAADVLLFTSRKGSEGSPTVVKEAVVMGLPVVSVDVGDVEEILEGVSPSAVVSFPAHADHAHARAELVETLADHASDVLASRARSNGRERRANLALEAAAERIVAVYREVIQA